MSEARTRVKRALPYLVVALAAAYLYHAAVHFEFHRRPGTLGPDAWPKGIALLMLLVAAYKAIALLARPQREPTPYEVLAAAGAPSDSDIRRHPWLLLLGMATTIAYVALVTPVGFFLCTAVYLAAFLWIGGYRRLRVIAATSVLGSLLLMFIFMKLVYVSLPIGTPPYSAVMIALMQLMGIR